MERSRFIAKLIGPICIAGGAGMLFNTAVFMSMLKHGLHDHLLIYVAGLLALTGGLAILALHNVWVCDWTLIITVFGWLAVIGGSVRMVVPQLVERIGDRMIVHRHRAVMDGWIALLLGVLLTYFAYVDPPNFSPARAARESPLAGARTMNIPDQVTPKVTTGPLPSSRKVYCAPDAAPDSGAGARDRAGGLRRGPVPVYDTTGPYTDPNFTVDVEKGLPRARLNG